MAERGTEETGDTPLPWRRLAVVTDPFIQAMVAGAFIFHPLKTQLWH